jgi:hypothetical protein
MASIANEPFRSLTPKLIKTAGASFADAAD